MLWELLEAIFVVSFFTVSSNMKPRFWTMKPKQSYGPVATEISKVQGHCGNQVFEQNRRHSSRRAVLPMSLSIPGVVSPGAVANYPATLLHIKRKDLHNRLRV